MIQRIKTAYLVMEGRYGLLFKVFRYGFSGATGAATNLLLLFFFTRICGFWYLFSSIFSYSIAFLIGFAL
ncbi:MAG: hypothetical protein WCT02_04135, partial [Candidatus Paceibacterota bacterium]